MLRKNHLAGPETKNLGKDGLVRFEGASENHGFLAFFLSIFYHFYHGFLVQTF